ncbi:polygalacturonase [Iris pallida]|uniref:Polygalacturonase n=1 Tax=Iris pallida TaxID=29817 RepID=A0AAX6EG58_IRIPA|nr:polygalacturonase [Iris pallida]KAJ6837358.1 polygalacturonase [Iris pallida]
MIFGVVVPHSRCRTAAGRTGAPPLVETLREIV